MRLTVGPLPSAVYWRRRAFVLGVLLVIVAVLYAACGTGSGADSKKTASTSTPSPTPRASADVEESDPAVLTPESGAPQQDQPSGQPPAGGGSGDPGATGAAPPPQAPPDTTPCGDDEITITPAPEKPVVAVRTPVNVRLIVKNSSNRSCVRDLGADFQELRIVKGAEMVWSSDHCGALKGSDPQNLAPGGTREYEVTWNGRYSTKCSSGAPVGPWPAAGQYQLLGRVGVKHSAPVTLTLR